MKTIIIGASGSLGKAIAYAEAPHASSLVLVATDRRDLSALKADLSFRYNCNVEELVLDLSDAKAASKVPADGDRYYFPIGQTLENDNFILSDVQINRMFQINAFSVFQVISNILKEGRKQPLDIIGFGSIAETRGRSNNVFYSASKRTLTSVFESLLHSSEELSVRPFLFQIGYMKSQLSFGKKLLFPVVEPAYVAMTVIKLVNNRTPGIYYMPSFWFWICMALKMIPWSIYRKLKF